MMNISTFEWQDILLCSNDFPTLSDFQMELTEKQVYCVSLAAATIDDGTLKAELAKGIFPPDGKVDESERKNIHENLEKLEKLAPQHSQAKRLHDLIMEIKKGLEDQLDDLISRLPADGLEQQKMIAQIYFHAF